MKHVIAGRFGQQDIVQVPVTPQEYLTHFDFIAEGGGFNHGINRALKDLYDLGIFPTETGFDLFLLATLVYAADTRISRRTESQDTWTREIKLVLPVLELELWSRCTETFQKLLYFLTGDRWELVFRSRPQEYSKTVALPDSNVQPQFTGVSLFSGGMDSLIGALNELSQGSRPLFVSHAADGATSKAQENCLDGLERAYPKAEFAHFRVWLQIKKGIVEGVGSENTTRSRSFLFIAVAMLAGSGLRRPFQLRVPENGLIALNVPLDPNRVGALSTRTTHPFYLARWQEVMDEIGIPSTIINPFWNLTKGEMVERCENRDALLSLLPVSMSCSSPNKGRWQKLGPQHCGYCLPCIIRRAAILRGFGDSVQDPTRYTLENFNGTLDTRKSIGQQVRSFQVAIDRLKENPRLARFLILKTGPLSDVADDHEALADVYLRGMLEVGEILKSVITTPLWSK
jgi:hypothetical protein